MSKKFKTPLAIHGDEAQLRTIISKLEEIGYRRGGITAMEHPNRYGNWHLVTNLDGKAGLLGILEFSSIPDRLKIVASDKDLVLALAAMVDDDELYEGEWCVYLADNPAIHFTHGKLYKATKSGWGSEFCFLNDRQSQDGFSGANKIYMRKATVDEIIQHFKSSGITFNPQDFVKQYPLTPDECSKTEQPIAYEVIQEWPNGPAIGKEFKPVSSNLKEWVLIIPDGTMCVDFRLSAENINKFKDFLRPVYKPTSVKVPYDGGELWLSITTFNRNRCAKFKDYIFSKEELIRMISEHDIGFGVNPTGTAAITTKFKATTFTFGCKGQYKGITAESIQKVIDLL